MEIGTTVTLARAPERVQVHGTQKCEIREQPGGENSLKSSLNDFVRLQNNNLLFY